jgi:8-oxo-dGTP pyrophosphatase MutT (NUDIX family)
MEPAAGRAAAIIAWMLCTSMVSLEHAIRAGWCLWTSDPVHQPEWTDANSASGQCASTALVVQDLLGGELLIADVHAGDGSCHGVHYWNLLAGGLEVDLTCEHFRSGEVVGEPRTIVRPPDVTRGRLAGHYHLLASRVARQLAGGGGTSASDAVSVKGVCVCAHGDVLLCRNHRGGWELPGGRPQVGELFQDCVERELREETGLQIAVDRVLGVEPLEVLPDAWVDIVAYECALPTGSVSDELRPSHEHVAIAFRDPTQLTTTELPVAYAQAIARQRAATVPSAPSAPTGPSAA